MSGRPSKKITPSDIQSPTNTYDTSAVNQPTASSTDRQGLPETLQSTAEEDVSTPAIIVTDSPSSRTSHTETTPRQSGPQAPHPPSVSRSSSQSSRSRHSSTAYDHPSSSWSQSQEAQAPETTSTTAAQRTIVMSSSSSPASSSTTSSTSGSGQSYQLPYAPFPYPMPANPRGSGQQKGK